ncbi:class II fructose-bisphosphate aldolase [Alkalihalobacillus sp. MEB130]|uniref:class II fructose-bisphosphate aldolase n=1 Tax=Alkalihalobacillus sp. MEB130 TaxID=2976704 RepID=UPI0028DF1A52|nr:class II fructose-bisphosphate aldolase [Alkalihalobacillus sp. MEB130]MDT8861801.1 class II fructose-bisphosphate aldolase [Alkalihalobacillus sp. MEB130]
MGWLCQKSFKNYKRSKRTVPLHPLHPRIGLEKLIIIAKLVLDQVSVPVALHLDHGSSFEVAMNCIRAGFSSVMFNGSAHGIYKKNS